MTETDLESDHAGGDGRFQLPYTRLGPQFHSTGIISTQPAVISTQPAAPPPNCERGYIDGVAIVYDRRTRIILDSIDLISAIAGH